MSIINFDNAHWRLVGATFGTNYYKNSRSNCDKHKQINSIQTLKISPKFGTTKTGKNKNQPIRLLEIISYTNNYLVPKMRLVNINPELALNPAVSFLALA